MPKRFYAYFLVLTLSVLSVTGLNSYCVHEQIDESRATVNTNLELLDTARVIQSHRYQQLADAHTAQYASLFDEQAHTMLVQREVAIAQEYANSIALIADMEAHRAHELDEKLARAQWEFRKLSRDAQYRDVMGKVQLEMAHGYIRQLTEYIKANSLPVPAPDPFQNDKVPQTRSVIGPKQDK